MYLAHTWPTPSAFNRIGKIRCQVFAAAPVTRHRAAETVKLPLGKPRSRRDWSERDRQALEAVQLEGVAPDRTAGAEREAGEPGEQRGEGCLPLQPGQRRAQAEVHPMAEPYVAGSVAPDIELARIMEPAGVAVGRAQEEHQRLARRDDGIRDLDLGGGEAQRGHLDGGVVAEELL